MPQPFPRLRAWAQRSLDYIFPPYCSACDASIPSTQSFCAQCLSEPGDPTLTALPGRHLPGAASCRSAGRYAPPLSTAIKKLKFKDRPDLARGLARYGLPCWNELLGTLGTSPRVVPVPLHPLRLAERGYNAPALLARQLISMSQGQLDTTILRRMMACAPQSHMPSAAARRANVHGSFACRTASNDKPIVLLDDVVTSGSTARACLRAMHAAGLRQVHVFTLACASADQDDA